VTKPAHVLRADAALIKTTHSYVYIGGTIICRQCRTAWPCEVWDTAEEFDPRTDSNTLLLFSLADQREPCAADSGGGGRPS
jgi:hypothetical protein